MKGRKGWFVGYVFAGVVVTVWGCVAGRQEGSREVPTPEVQPVQAGQTAQPAVSLSAPEVYRQEVPPLTTLQCGQCHYTVFSTIRDKGGKHQLECRYCHETFHNYRPGVAWEDVVPHCENCHVDVHDPAYTECKGCHQQPHAPIASLVGLETLAEQCGGCHAGPASQLEQHESAHADQDCTDCHYDRHGYVPGCVECHDDPHAEYVDNSGCTVCHPVHAPLEIAYGENIPNEICGGCHEEVYSQLKSGTKKHAYFQCAFCHSDRHGNIPECEKCHAGVHSKALLDRFEGCGACHGNPHLLEWVYSIPKQ